MTKGWPGASGACRRSLLGFAILFALLSQARGQEVWRHIDGQGHIRYADRPFPGAVRTEPPGTTSWLARASSPSDSLPARGESQAPTAVSAPALKIAYPAADETVWGAGGELEVRVEFNASMPGDARLSILLDGAEAPWQGQPPAVRLANVWRGEHRLRARLLDSASGELAVSEEVRFFKREPTVSATQPRRP